MTEFTYWGPAGQPLERRPVFQIRTDQIEVTTNLPEPDPNWTVTCACGATHRYHEGRDHYQTLTWVIDQHAVGDWPEEGHYVCTWCGETITPGLRGPSMFRQSMPGMTHYYVDGIEVDPDEYQRRVTEAIQSCADAYRATTGVGGPVSVLVGDGDVVPVHEAVWITRLIFWMAGQP